MGVWVSTWTFYIDAFIANRIYSVSLSHTGVSMSDKTSIIPLSLLVSSDKNMYELTNAAIHRSKQICMAGSDGLDAAAGKIVSLAVKEIVTGEVLYKIKQD